MTTSKQTERKRSQSDYNLGFKLAVVSQVEQGEMTYKQAQKTYGIQGRSTVLVWLRKHVELQQKSRWQVKDLMQLVVVFVLSLFQLQPVFYIPVKNVVSCDYTSLRYSRIWLLVLVGSP